MLFKYSFYQYKTVQLLQPHGVLPYMCLMILRKPLPKQHLERKCLCMPTQYLSPVHLCQYKHHNTTQNYILQVIFASSLRFSCIFRYLFSILKTFFRAQLALANRFQLALANWGLIDIKISNTRGGFP